MLTLQCHEEDRLYRSQKGTGPHQALTNVTSSYHLGFTARPGK